MRQYQGLNGNLEVSGGSHGGFALFLTAHLGFGPSGTCRLSPGLEIVAWTRKTRSPGNGL